MLDPVATATLILAVVTAVMAMATLWLALETRRARRDAAEHRDREAFRLALVELSDHVLVWSSGAPWSGSAAERVPDQVVDLQATREALASAAVPGDLLRYLLWSMTAIRSMSAAYLDILNDRVPGMYALSETEPRWASREAQDLYAVTLGQMLLTARLLAAEAGRRGFAEIPRAFAQQFAFRPTRSPESSSLETLGYPLPDPPPLPDLSRRLEPVPAEELGLPLSQE